MSSLTKEQRQRLDQLAVKMKTAKGKELDAITAEVDEIIGHQDLQDRDPRAEAEAQGRWNRNRSGGENES